MHKLIALTSLLFMFACSSSDSNTTRVLRLDGNLDGCASVVEVCAESFPPQCFDYCADQDPAPGDDCEPVAIAPGTPDDPSGGEPGEPGEGYVCGGTPCIPLDLPGSDDGSPTAIYCVEDPSCVVAYDVETGSETVTCLPPSDGGGSDGEPGAVPGDPGPGA